MVTSVPYAAEVVSRMYVGRADSENRIKELKEDLSLDTFCLKSFDATDAAFRMGCVLYNLLAQFRETVLPRSWFERRLRAVRDFVLLVGADLVSQGRRVQIRFAMPEPDRPEFLRRLRTMSEGLPIAAQLEWSLTDQEPSHPDKIITPVPLISVESHHDGHRRGRRLWPQSVRLHGVGASLAPGLHCDVRVAVADSAAVRGHGGGARHPHAGGQRG